mmetsp:Transcript_37977/g.62056  ORF Transcript_37977/g.62056 Transcript_37977/m.62056 type:complete len:140 (+) Transcript_37977:156-575(+)
MVSPHPLLSALGEDYALPSEQAIANAAIIVVFAYLVPLLTMEINFFRLAVYKSWRRQDRLLEKKKRTVAEADGVDSGADATFAAGGEGGASKNEQQGGGGEEANTLITGAATILGEMTCSRATVGASNTQHHHDDGSIL